MEYIYSVKNGENTYSVFRSRRVSGGKILNTYGICAENSTDTVYVPDVTTVEDIIMCMVKVLSTDMVKPERIHNILYKFIS